MRITALPDTGRPSSSRWRPRRLTTAAANASPRVSNRSVASSILAAWAGLSHEPKASTRDDSGESATTFREAKEKFVGDWERDFFIRALRATGGNISRAAERTGMYRQSFQQKMRELGIALSDLGLAPKNEQ